MSNIPRNEENKQAAPILGGLPQPLPNMHNDPSLVPREDPSAGPGGQQQPEFLSGDNANNQNQQPGDGLGTGPAEQNTVPQQHSSQPGVQPNIATQHTTNTANGRHLVSLERSYSQMLFQRYAEESELMQPLRSSGFYRSQLEEKQRLLHLNPATTLTDKETLAKLKIDGIYVDDPQVHQKFTDTNVQKLEERLLRQWEWDYSANPPVQVPIKTNYFKQSGELKLHNDLLADEITRPADLAFEKSETFRTKDVNAILCNRLHSFKKKYYQLNINVGQIRLKNYPGIFCKEDRLDIEITDLYKEYERRISLVMIPFYQDRLDNLAQQQEEKARAMAPDTELEFLQLSFDETMRKLDQEKREVQDLASLVYEKWKEIKLLRRTNNMASTNVKLKVHKNDESIEPMFNLTREEISKKNLSGGELPSSELSRQRSAGNLECQVRLIVNGKEVAKSKVAKLLWPAFEFELAEQFVVYLFTMPSSIQLEIRMGGIRMQVVDVLDIDIPGEHVKALTSASSLVKETYFSKGEFLKRSAQPVPGSNVKSITELQSLEEEKKELERIGENQDPNLPLNLNQQQRQAAEQKRKAEEERLKVTDIRGAIFYKAEWKGDGPKMPPMRAENIFKHTTARKLRNYYNDIVQREILEQKLYIDVNDPRNEQTIKILRETKNDFLVKLLQLDAKNPLHDCVPFRHKLLLARMKDISLAKTPIPLLEKEIIDASRSKFYLDQLEVIQREELYREFLDKRAEKGTDEEEEQHVLQQAQFLTFDNETVQRRQAFFDKLKQKQKEIKSGQAKPFINYKSVVSEFVMEDTENKLLALVNKIFVSGRRLRPAIIKKPAVALDTVKKSGITIHIIKGYNVPVRSEAFKQINAYKQIQQANPYGGPGQPGPTARVPPGMMQQQINGMSGMGGSIPGMNQPPGQDGMFRSSMQGGLGGTGFMGGSNPGQNFQMSGNFQPGAFSGQGGMPQMQPRQIGGDQDEYLRRTQNMLEGIYKMKRVETFVEVRIVYNEVFTIVKSTNVAEGDSPDWNELLTFPLKAENGKRFTREELVNSKTMIYISIFDQVVRYFKEDEFSSMWSSQVEYRYLGSFTIPLNTILQNPPKTEGMFKVNRPLAPFNYETLKQNIFLMDPASEASQHTRDHEEITTYVNLSISLDPVLELPAENEYEYYPGAENAQLLYSATNWIKAMKKKKLFANRHYRAFGENVMGQSVLLCRYLTPQSPPIEIYDFEHYVDDEFAIEKSARFVSMIPFIEDNRAFEDLPDLFCTSQEFIDLGAGDYEEHAILLCNYFNFIDTAQGRPNFKSYLVIGKGMPEGYTAYVMRRDNQTNNVELWNAIKGEAYYFGRKVVEDKLLSCINIGVGAHKMDIRLHDPTCQLKEIGCVISNDNIWANIQKFTDPAMLNYDVDSPSSWKPFFTKDNRTKHFPGEQILTVQPPLQYSPPFTEIKELEIKIQKFISSKFMEERINSVKMTTKWNVETGDSLRQILHTCEIYKMKARQGATNSSLRNDIRNNANEDLDINLVSTRIRQAIETIGQGKRTWGFPINMTFVTFDSIWEEVKNTKLHAIQDRNATFSLSVYVYPYPSNILSVWLYIAAFKRRFDN